MLRMRQPLWPLSYPAVMILAPTRSRTSRLRHRKPVLCPAELWTPTEAPTVIEPAASWVEARCSVQTSYGAKQESLDWLAWTVVSIATRNRPVWRLIAIEL